MTISQAAAAERAAMFASLAETEAYRLAHNIGNEHPSCDRLIELGNLWAAVAGVTLIEVDEFVHDEPRQGFDHSDHAHEATMDEVARCEAEMNAAMTTGPVPPEQHYANQYPERRPPVGESLIVITESVGDPEPPAIDETLRILPIGLLKPRDDAPTEIVSFSASGWHDGLGNCSHGYLTRPHPADEDWRPTP